MLSDIGQVAVFIWLIFTLPAFILSLGVERRESLRTGLDINWSSICWATFCSHIYILTYIAAIIDESRDKTED